MFFVRIGTANFVNARTTGRRGLWFIRTFPFFLKSAKADVTVFIQHRTEENDPLSNLLLALIDVSSTDRWARDVGGIDTRVLFSTHLRQR